MGKVRKKFVSRQVDYGADPPRQHVYYIEEEYEKELNLKDFCDLTENEKKRINTFLSKDLYEKELKFKMPNAEVKCITDGVKTIVEQLMTAVGDKEPLLEISHQHLVGSMAEGTSIIKPDEFDFLVVLKHFSDPGAISFQDDGSNNRYKVYNENIDFSLRKNEYVCLDENRNVSFENGFMSNILKEIISSQHEPLHVKTDHGKLTINSTIVCYHGPASVVKLIWEPKSESSTPLDILIDITPCIEQKGIDKLDDLKVISDGYKSHILNDDMFMLIPTFTVVWTYTSFEAANTTTEVKIVNTLSSHHKTSYMILKYCFNTMIKKIHKKNNYRYSHTLLSSYFIKTFLLRHVVRCEAEECLFTCLLDIADDLKKNESMFMVDGIFRRVAFYSSEVLSQVIDNVIDRLGQIGKKGYSKVRHEDFRKACPRTVTPHIIEEQVDKLARDEVDGHLSVICENHTKYNWKFDSLLQARADQSAQARGECHLSHSCEIHKY